MIERPAICTARLDAFRKVTGSTVLACSVNSVSTRSRSRGVRSGGSWVAAVALTYACSTLINPSPSAWPDRGSMGNEEASWALRAAAAQPCLDSRATQAALSSPSMTPILAYWAAEMTCNSNACSWLIDRRMTRNDAAASASLSRSRRSNT